MKRQFFLLLLTVVFTFLSCSSDDDNLNQENNDPIIGTWVLDDVEPTGIYIDACEEESTITFNKDYTGTAIFYVLKECQGQSGSGVWENLGNNQYRITVPILGVTTGEVQFFGASEFNFVSENGMTFIFLKKN